MGKRNIRIPADAIADKIGEMAGKDVHVVLLDGTTFSGQMLRFEAGKIKVSDANASWTSRKRHTHTIDLNQVQEIIMDLVTPY